MERIIAFIVKVAIVAGACIITNRFLTPLLQNGWGEFKFIGVIILILIYLVILAYFMDYHPWRKVV